MSEQAEWQQCVEESGLSAETALIAMAALETMPDRNQGVSTPLHGRRSTLFDVFRTSETRFF